jgi:hypothetical protein
LESKWDVIEVCVLEAIEFNCNNVVTCNNGTTIRGNQLKFLKESPIFVTCVSNQKDFIEGRCFLYSKATNFENFFRSSFGFDSIWRAHKGCIAHVNFVKL